jgi:hypothetical protein
VESREFVAGGDGSLNDGRRAVLVQMRGPVRWDNQTKKKANNQRKNHAKKKREKEVREWVSEQATSRESKK